MLHESEQIQTSAYSSDTYAFYPYIQSKGIKKRRLYHIISYNSPPPAPKKKKKKKKKKKIKPTKE